LQDIAKIFSAAPQLPRLAVKTAAAPGATADSHEDDSEERELFSPETPASPTGGAVEQLVVSGDRMPKLYCVLISMHGLVRGEHMELGKDPDTGGQVRTAGQKSNDVTLGKVTAAGSIVQCMLYA
jgi:sucrose-phosphate synthase